MSVTWPLQEIRLPREGSGKGLRGGRKGQYASGEGKEAGWWAGMPEMRSASPLGGARPAAEQTDSCPGVLTCRVTVISSVGRGLNAPFLSASGTKSQADFLMQRFLNARF